MCEKQGVPNKKGFFDKIFTAKKGVQLDSMKFGVNRLNCISFIRLFCYTVVPCHWGQKKSSHMPLSLMATVPYGQGALCIVLICLYQVNTIKYGVI